MQIETMRESAGFFFFLSFFFKKKKEPTFVYYHSRVLFFLQTCWRQVSKILKWSDYLPEPRCSRWAALLNKSVICLKTVSQSANLRRGANK